MKPRIITGSVLWTPGADHVLELAAGDAPALEFPALVPVDLTESHGINITLQRLQEMAGAYDPAVEMASLNLDHNWGGPSLGWCERVWLQDAALWVRYIDLDPAHRRAGTQQALHATVGRDRAQPSRDRRLVPHRLCPSGQRPPCNPRASARDPLPPAVRAHRKKGDPCARR